MPSPLDLIPLPVAQAALPATLTAADAALLPFWITSASRMIARYTRRVFAVRSYDEVRTPALGTPFANDPPSVALAHFPVRSLDSCRGARIPAVTIANTDSATNQRATAEILTLGDAEWAGMPSPVGLRLVRVASGVSHGSTFLWSAPQSWDFAASPGTAAGSISANSYTLCYTAVSADGPESPASPTVSCTLAATGSIAGYLPPLPAWASAWRLYAGTATPYPQGSFPGGAFTLASLIGTGSQPPTSSYATVADVATAINGLGSGWSAVTSQASPSPASFAASDLYREPGPAGCLAQSAGTGAALSVFARDLHPSLDPASGTLTLPHDWAGYGNWAGYAGGFPGSWQGPSPPGRPADSWLPAVRTGYRAGFAAVPEAVQQACAILVQTMYHDAKTSGVYESQRMGNLSYTFATLQPLPRSVVVLLAPYRRID